ncbi:MAG: hypothetical protein HC769_11165 [Cyanobacteria bacterium CRU_2_1]|nr:hypothetical protein [Cyanobacteria bacterium RU_5_0]NJR59351.1 hypothetical protein [Cyanobacteria bacterium CRU_2_1]
MNANEQANSIERVSKIAAVVNLFRSQFPEASADLRPWVIWGITLPLPDTERKLRQICLQILQLFNRVTEGCATEW